MDAATLQTGTPTLRHGARPGASQALSVVLRAETRPWHDRVEAALGLPHAIGSRADYVRGLRAFLALHEAVETRCRAYDGFARLGIALEARSRCPALRADLAALGADVAAVGRPKLAGIADFPRALGALYVVEGSLLGGPVIAADLAARLGPAIAGADTFFLGARAETGARWRAFRGALDRFGTLEPESRDGVVEGAKLTFDAFAAAFATR